MRKYLCLPVLLLVAACGGVGERSPGLDVTYDQTNSRDAFHDVTTVNPDCLNKNPFDSCDVPYQTTARVSPGRR